MFFSHSWLQVCTQKLGLIWYNLVFKWKLPLSIIIFDQVLQIVMTTASLSLNHSWPIEMENSRDLSKVFKLLSSDRFFDKLSLTDAAPWSPARGEFVMHQLHCCWAKITSSCSCDMSSLQMPMKLATHSWMLSVLMRNRAKGKTGKESKLHISYHMSVTAISLFCLLLESLSLMGTYIHFQL